MHPFLFLAAVSLGFALARSAGSIALAADASPAPSAAASGVPSASPSAASSASPSAMASDAAASEDPKMTQLASSLVTQAQSGKIDRSLFESKMGAALTPALVATMSQRMGPLGKPKDVRFESFAIVDGYRSYHYRVAWGSVAVDESFALNSDGKIAGWYFQPAT